MPTKRTFFVWITASPAYAAVTQQTNNGFVGGLYQNILGRVGSAQEISSWVSQLNAGVSRTQVARAFLSSTEYRTTFIKNIYSAYLLRTPSSSEVQTWLNYWTQNNPRQEDLKAIFTGCNEYTARLGYSPI